MRTTHFWVSCSLYRESKSEWRCTHSNTILTGCNVRRSCSKTCSHGGSGKSGGVLQCVLTKGARSWLNYLFVYQQQIHRKFARDPSWRSFMEDLLHDLWHGNNKITLHDPFNDTLQQYKLTRLHDFVDCVCVVHLRSAFNLSESLSRHPHWQTDDLFVYLVWNTLFVDVI